MPEQWIIQVQGKEYGPADLATLREWKADGRVLAINPARRVDTDEWKTAAHIPSLFQIEPPPVQRSDVEARVSPAEITERIATGTAAATPSRPPTRNILVETFRIYF